MTTSRLHWSFIAGLTLLVAAAGCEVTFRVGNVVAKDAGVGSGDNGNGATGGLWATDAANRDFGGGSGGSDGGSRDTASGSGGTDAGSTNPVPGPHSPLTSSSKLDLLFMIDDSYSMAPLQEKMRARLPHFMDVLKTLPGGPPDLHVAVVSSSLGAGKFANVPGCGPGTIGNVNGAFQHPAGCTQLNAGASFLSSSPIAGVTGARSENFTGDITDVFACLANLGDKGCGFEHQFEAVRLALQRSLTEGDTNSGFLRPEAMLAVVMLTNEDDCSVSVDSDLFDPAQQTLADPYGGLQSYRCNEFGHRCNQPLPHDTDGLPRTFDGCRSAEDGKLVTVSGFVDFLFSLKARREQIFVGAIAGPPAPYTVESREFMLGSGGTEIQPVIRHACTAGAGGTEYADPAVRVKQWTEAFGPNSFFSSICADDYENTMVSLAQRMVEIP